MKRYRIISELVMVVLFAFFLISCETVAQEAVEIIPIMAVESAPAITYEEDYEIVGYKFIFRLDGDIVTFKFVDAVGDSEIPIIAKALMDILPSAESFENPLPGNITIKLVSNMTAADFNKFIEHAKVLIYNTIY